MSVYIEVDNITKTFGAVKALDQVSLSFDQGRSYCLIGENGSGKSTLIKILSGAYRPTSGRITIDDQSFLNGITPSESIQAGVDVIYQDFQLFPNLSIAENIMIEHFAVSKKPIIDWKHIYETAEQAISKLGLKFDVKAPIIDLSTADRQLVAIAKAISRKAKCIIMDEATTAITQKEVDILFSIVRDLNAQNVSTIFVSHKIAEVMHLAEHFIVLRNGKKVFDQPAGNVQRVELVSYMSGREASEGSRNRIAEQKEIGAQMLEVEELGDGRNFKDISFELRKGEILGITGLLGSGVQSLANSIFGLNPYHSGAIYIENSKVRINNPVDALKCGVALVPADRLNEGLHIEKSIGDNIVSVIIDRLAHYTSVDRGKKRSLQNKWIKRYSIKTPSAEALVSSLSGGNQQRVLLSKWLITMPKVLVLCSPTVGVDVFSKLDIHKSIGHLAAQGLSIIVVSDDIPEIYALADRILIIKNGALSRELLPANTSADQISDLLLKG